MQTKRLLLLLASLLFLLPLPATALELEVGAPNNAGERRMNEIMVNRITRAVFEEDPSGFFMLVLASEGGKILPGFHNEFGITDEQVGNLAEIMDAFKPDNFEEFENIFDGVQRKIEEGVQHDLTEVEDEALVSMLKYLFESANASAAEALTDEQIQKMDGMILALTGGLESPLFNARHMNALEMTDAQKEQFKAIDEAVMPGREKLIAAISAETLKMMDTGKMDFKGLLATFSTFREYQTDLKNRRMQVLTAAQIAKVKTLSRLPKFLSPLNLIQQWVPGPNSWQPGDPIPGGYREERNKRGNFPRPAN